MYATCWEPIHYESKIRFKYGDRVQIVGHEGPSEYTVDNIFNYWRFYDKCTGTVVGIGYNYNSPDNSRNKLVEVTYAVRLDDYVGWEETVYFQPDNLQLIDEENECWSKKKFEPDYWEFSYEEYEEDEDESLEDFIDTAIDVLEDWDFSSDNKSWANKLIRALKCAKEYLYDNDPVE